MKKNVYLHAAMAGLMAGSSLLSTAARADEKKADPAKTPAAAEKKGDKNACGGANGCAGKGTGAAASADKHACKGHNACKGKGGCKSGDNGCAGKNSCKGKGGCATPAKSEKK